MQNWTLTLLAFALFAQAALSQTTNGNSTLPEPTGPVDIPSGPADDNDETPNVTLPGYCPALIRPGMPEYASLKASFNAFVEYVAITAPRTAEACPRPSSISLGVNVRVHTERALQASLPNGAQIISIALQILSGFFFQKIIYYYNGGYFYVMYNTGCRAFRLLQYTPGDTTDATNSTTLRAGPQQALNIYDIVTRVIATPIREGLTSSSLDVLYNCVPGIEEFQLVKCQVTAATFGNFFMAARSDVTEDI